MKKPEELREVTENVLCGLTADESLRSRILQNAKNAGVPSVPYPPSAA